MRLTPLALLALAACNQANDTTTSADEDTALEQSATMGTTTQESVSGTDATAADATGATAPAGTTDQYGNFSAARGGGDASADTALGGKAGSLTEAPASGLSGTAGTPTAGETDKSGSPKQ